MDLSEILKKRIDIVTEMQFKTIEIAANVMGDLAPTHVRKNAEYVGAIMYQNTACGKLANALYNMKWLKDVGDHEKPAICVVKKADAKS